ncbi:MAG: hypothetical protein INR65_10295 [Gluconacetobacter diazotrophicus]|nr:hypothetical protein [Gluconacetobacter diazotrophicus]
MRGAPRFEDYPARRETVFPPAVPILSSRDGRMFRTAIQADASRGPNFAGHWTVAEWGCGAGCRDAALVDARSGAVRFVDGVRDVDGTYVDLRDTAACDMLCFRWDSRLLVVQGAPDEDPRRDGIAFYEWTGRRLRLLRFVPAAELCPGWTR